LPLGRGGARARRGIRQSQAGVDLRRSERVDQSRLAGRDRSGLHRADAARTRAVRGRLMRALLVALFLLMASPLGAAPATPESIEELLVLTKAEGVLEAM